MKKILCLVLALVMALSLAIPAMAVGTNNWKSGTTVTYTGTGGDEGTAGGGSGSGSGGSGTTTEYYYVDVPASLTIGTEGTVKVYGLWAKNRKVTVGLYATAHPSDKLTMTNSVTSETVEATITFAGITMQGNSTKATTAEDGAKTATVKAAFAEGAAPALGTWSGTITYAVNIADAT